MKHTMIPSLLAGAALFTAQAGAAVLFSDDFSGTGSGTGFSDNWNAGTISGGEITVTGTTSFRTLSSSITTSTMDFWFVSNLSITGPSSQWGGLSFYAGTNEDGFFGSDSATTTWEFDTDGMADQTSTVPNFTGNPTLLITHITATSIDMWIDPADTSSPAALGTADASNTVNPITPNASWTRLRIGASGSGPVTVTVNDMTAATTFGEAIPEPSVALLAGLLAPVMLLRRRRS